MVDSNTQANNKTAGAKDIAAQIEKHWQEKKAHYEAVRKEEDTKRVRIKENLSEFHKAIEAKKQEVIEKQNQEHAARMEELDKLADNLTNAAEKKDDAALLELLSQMRNKF